MASDERATDSDERQRAGASVFNNPHTMQPVPQITRPGTSGRGFTLIELMIAIAVVGILTAVALPVYKDSIRKGRRADAFAALSAVQQAQERWRSNRENYAADAVLTTAPPAGLGLSATSAAGHYTISIGTVTATGYVFEATAISTSSQAQDGECAKLAVRLQGGNLAYGSGASSTDWTDAKRCWVRS